MNEHVKLEGFVTIWQEDDKGQKEILVERVQNHFVDFCLKGLLSFFLGNSVNGWKSGASAYGAYSWATGFAIFLGIDTITPTTHNLTALVNPIGPNPGTPQSSSSGVNRSNPATGVWNFSYIAQWAPGLVTGTVGELALYLRPFDSLTPAWSWGTGGGANVYKTQVMCSRLSVADGDFTGVTIDPSKSFVVQWGIQISFS